MPTTKPGRTGTIPHFPGPYVTVDVVVFTLRDGVLQVLLVQRPSGGDEPHAGLWALPGGYVDIERDRDLLGCARRKLKEKTGVAGPYLEQLGSWGDATRDPRGWSVTHAYLALVAPHEHVQPGANAADAAWYPVDALSPRRKLAFDHGSILQCAVERLRGKAEYTSLPAFLLAEPFTLPQLQQAYETVLGRTLDKSAFRTRMLAAGFLEETGIVEGHAHRPPLGYRLASRARPVVFPRTFSPRERA